MQDWLGWGLKLPRSLHDELGIVQSSADKDNALERLGRPGCPKKSCLVVLFTFLKRRCLDCSTVVMVASFAFARYEAISPLLYRPALAHGLQVTEVPSYLTESNVAPDGWKTSSFCKGLFSRAMLVWGGASLSCQWHGVVIYFQPYRPKGKTVMHASSHLLWAPWESWLGDLSRRVGRSVKKAPFFPFSAGCTEEFSLLYNFCFQQIWLFDNFTLCFMARVKWTHVLRRHVLFFAFQKTWPVFPCPCPIP